MSAEQPTFRYAGNKESVSLCVIDAVYSIGVLYKGVQNVVSRYCKHFGLQPFRSDRRPETVPESQETLSALIAHFDELGTEIMAGTVFDNRQRTSTQNGVLKAEAVRRFATVLRSAGIEDFATALAHLHDKSLERKLKEIPGQHISVGYFWMLAGTDDLIKPDRMVQRFALAALGREVPIPQLQTLLVATTAELRVDRPSLTPRLLDYGIWLYQSRLEAQRALQKRRVRSPKN